MPIPVQVTQVGLEASIQAAAAKAGRNLKIDLGANSRSIDSLSRPLGKITGQADEFTKSMEAANARVLAFGASVGVLAGVVNGFQALVATTIEVESTMANINSVLNKTSSELDEFKGDIFDVARTTGSSFETVSTAALELSRQGLDSTQVISRLNDAMILSRLSGLGAAESVDGLTAAFNSFKSQGETSATILNKVSAAAAAYAVSEKDLIEGIKRSGSVAQQAGVNLNELASIITAVQQRTSAGGAVIGNSFKTIFTRIGKRDTLTALEDLGIEITDTAGKVLPATKLLENLAQKINGLNQLQISEITQKIGGGFQIDKLLAGLKDMSSEGSVFAGTMEKLGSAGNTAYSRNIALNETLAASINAAGINLKELANTLGEIGVTGNLNSILSFFNSFAEGVQDILDGEGIGSQLAQGIVKGIGGVISGPGLAIFGAIIIKLSYDLLKFGTASLKSFFGISQASKEIATLQGTIANALLNNKKIQSDILALEGNRVAQAAYFSTALDTQIAKMNQMRAIAADITPNVYRNTPLYRGKKASGSADGYVPTAAEGYAPAVAQESANIKKGVGGARPSDRPVVIPNFSFGGGKTGAMVAHTGEHIVKNYGGSGGSAVFNRDMVKSMGLPNGAQKIGAAGGFVPNFAETEDKELEFYLKQVKENATKELLEDKKINPSLIKTPSDLRSLTRGQGFNNRLGSRKLTKEDAYVLLALESKEAVAGEKQAKKDDNIFRADAAKYAMLVPQIKESRNIDPAGTFKKGEKKIPFELKNLKIRGPFPQDIGKAANPEDENLKDNIRKSIVDISTAYAGTLGLGEPKSSEISNLLKTNSGAVGAISGAVGAGFEAAVMSQIGTSNFSQQKINRLNKEGGDFDIRGATDDVNTLFNLRGIKIMDFKSGITDGTIASFAKKIYDQDTKDKERLDEKLQQALQLKPKTSASGYIPNFASGFIPQKGHYFYDRYKLKAELQQPVLDAILKTPASKQKDGLIGPVGSGKSTIASGPFIQSMEDVKKAKSFTLISSSSLAKKEGGISDEFRLSLNAIKDSKGILTYLNVDDDEIKRRREINIARGSNDARSEGQLKGSVYAPLNQPEFIKILEKAMGGKKNFKIKDAAKGFVPNFVSKSRSLGKGYYGEFFELGTKKIGEENVPIGVKRFRTDTIDKRIDLKQNIQTEYAIARLISENPLMTGITGPKVFGTLEESLRRKSIRKEVINDKLGRDAVGNHADVFGDIISNVLKTKGLNMIDLHGENYTVNSAGENALNQNNKSYLNSNAPNSMAKESVAFAENFSSKGGIANIIDTGLTTVKRKDLQKKLDKYSQIPQIPQVQKNAARGFVPNFASQNAMDAMKRMASYQGSDPSILADKEAAIGRLQNEKLKSASGSKILKKQEFLNIFNFQLDKDGKDYINDENNTPDKLNIQLNNGYLSGALEIDQEKLKNKISAFTAAKGFVPNFADPLKDAISREVGAGVNPSQVYVDQHSSLKNSGNPMGLMVANTRDEPSGGFQGIARARKEGQNAQTYGAVNGFVPNYADPNLTPYVGMTQKPALQEQSRKYGEELIKLTTEIIALTKQYSLIRQKNSPKAVALEGEIKALNENREALTKSSKETRKAITESTKGVLGTGRTIIGTQAKVSDTAKSSGDMLGKVFAAQAGLSALTAATADAESNLGKLSNIVADGASSFTTAVFAIQGIGAMGGAIGGVVSKLGPYGIALAGTIAAFKIGGDSVDLFTGLTNKAAKAMDKVTEASEKAAFKLSDFSKSQQTTITKSAIGLVQGAAMSTDFGKDVKNQKTANFEGFDLFSAGALEKVLQQSVTNSLAAGVDYNEIYNAINKSGKDGFYSSEEVDKLIDSFSELSTKAREAKTALSTFTIGEGKSSSNTDALKTLTDVQFKKALEKQDSFSELRGVLSNSEGKMTGRTAQNKALTDERERIRGTIAQKEQLTQNLIISGEKALLDILKKRLDITLQLREVLSALPSLAEGDLIIQKNLNSTLDSRKTQIDNQLEANKRVRDLVTEQSKVVQSSLTDKVFEGQAFGSLDATGKVNKDEYEKVKNIITETTREIEKQGGYNSDIAEGLKKRLASLAGISENETLQLNIRDKIVDSITQEANGLKVIMAAKNMIADTEQKLLGLAKAKSFIQEQANRVDITSLTNKNSEIDAESRLARARLESQKIANERKVIGGSNYAKSSSQAENIRAEQKSIQEELGRSNEKIINDLQKSLLEKAFEVKLDNESVEKFKESFGKIKVDVLQDKKINQVEGLSLENVGKDFAKQIEEARKTEALAALNASFDKKQADLDNINNTLDTAFKFKDIILSAANEFKNIFSGRIIKGAIQSSGPIDPDAGKTELGKEYDRSQRRKAELDNLLNVAKVTMSGIPLQPSNVGATDNFVSLYKEKTPQKEILSAQQEKLNNEKASAIDLIKNAPILGDILALPTAALDSLSASTLEAKNNTDTLSNTLAQLGADASTFNNSVANVFKNLKEEAAQIQFSMLGATSADSLVSGGLDRIKNTSLQAGPQTNDTVKDTANTITLLSKRLDYETAIDAATKSRLKFEYEQTVKILALKEELLQASSDEETFAILKKIKQTESQREGFGSRLSSAFSSTAEERQRNMEDSLISSSTKFRDTMIDGITTAIEGATSLGEVLQNAALDFAREMTSNNLKNIFSAGQEGIGNLFSGAFQQKAAGGKITGGSGNKDDVPAMLMGGEFVMNKKAVSKYGVDLMEKINKGSISHFAKGGKVENTEPIDRYQILSGGIGSSPSNEYSSKESDVLKNLPNQTGQGGFKVPGLYGESSITGQKDLLSFASQSYSSGAQDKAYSGKGYAGVSLEGESKNLTQFGRRTGRMADLVTENKKAALGLFVQASDKERDDKKQYDEELKAYREEVEKIKKQEKAAKNAFLISTAANLVVSTYGPGVSQGLKTGGFKGAFESIGNTTKGIGSGLTGNFDKAGQYFSMANTDFSKAPKGIVDGDQMKGIGSSGNSIGNMTFKATAYGLASIDPDTKKDQEKANAGVRGYEYFSQTKGASGRTLKAGKSVASNYFPLGTILQIDGKEYRVDDRGGMSNNVIDFFAGEDEGLYNQFAKMGKLNVKVLSRNVTKAATGGRIPETSGIDTVPAMLSGGEFVMNAAATKRIGPSTLNQMNSAGGDAGSTLNSNTELLAKLDELISASKDSARNVNVSVSNGSNSEDKKADNTSSSSPSDAALSKKIKDAVVKVLMEEKRIGGVLRSR